jgi:DNA-binding MarR family transcriptional regulator
MDNLISVSSNDKKALASLAGALGNFNSLYAEMTAMQMRVFIAVARRGSVTGKQIAVSLDTTGSNVSRCVAALSDVTVARRNVAPLNLVELTNDPLDRRVRYVQLSEKGKAFVKELTSHF